MLSVYLSLPMPEISNSYFPHNPSLWEELNRLFVDFNINENPPQPSIEEIWEEFRRNGRDYEYCPDTDANEMAPLKITTPRRKRHKKILPKECVFCRNNGEEETFYKQHILRDSEGRIACPVLRAYTCPLCEASGDDAHTMKYCPKGRQKTSVYTIRELSSMNNSKSRTYMR